MSTVTAQVKTTSSDALSANNTLSRAKGNDVSGVTKSNGYTLQQKPKGRKWEVEEDGRFKNSPHDISELLIPSFAGQGSVTAEIQKASKLAYLAVAIVGLSGFYMSSNSSVRTGCLSLVFPGAGFLAVGGIAGYVGFTISLLLLPLCLFAWFGAGGLAFPLADWIFSGVIAVSLAKSEVVESSAAATLGLVGVIYTYFWTRATTEEGAEETKRSYRNGYLGQADKQWVSETEASPEPGTRELSLEQLRFVQHIIDLALKAPDDWEGFTIIDQFQPAALRYQLYEFVNVLGVYTTHFAPNFRGYAAQAMQNSIEKSLLPKVMNFWKWESLWGKFTTNYDPVIKDNIMVTGFLTLAAGIYQSCTGDDRYTKKHSLVFQITDKIKYKHSIHSMYEALVKNWDESDFTLYPCEPNWIYSMCNLGGMAAATIHDRLYKTQEGARVMQSFYRHFEEDFFTKGGSCIPIKSALTGFTIPGLCGIMGDTSNALFCSPFMPTLAKRMWLMTRTENVSFDAKGEVHITGLKGADKIDGGNYKPAEYGPYTLFAPAAAEWGDQQTAAACVAKVDRLAPVIVDPKTGAKFNTGLSVITRGMLARARIMQGGDWATTVTRGPEESCRNGPVLEDVPYPEVLVAKAYSHTSKDLELVLYPGIEQGTFHVTLSKLVPHAQYAGQGDQIITADAKGTAKVPLVIHGRAHIHITPLE